jgi:hypothetical protein
MFFKQKKRILIHEDDYKQIQILQNKSYFLVMKTINNINENIHEEMFVPFDRGQLNSEQKKLDIDFDELKKALNIHAFQYYEILEVGYGMKSSVKKENHVAWGFENYVVIVEYYMQQVHSISLNYIELSETLNVYPIKLKQFFIELCNKYNDLMLVDWNEDKIIDLNNHHQLNDYIEFLTPKR